MVAEKDGEILRIEIENLSPKEQVERNIKKNIEYSQTLHIIASDEEAEKKVIQVALQTLFRLRKEKPTMDYRVKVANIEELRRNGWDKWFEIKV